MEAIKLEILDILFELRFSEFTYLPLSDNLKPFVVSRYCGNYPPTIVEVTDQSFDGADSSEHLSKNYHSLSVQFRPGGYHLFQYQTGQFLSNRDLTEVKLWAPLERQMSIDHSGCERFTGDPPLRLILWARSSIEGYCYMHGALIVLDHKYILLVGRSGSGKTTLSNLACDCGATLLTEEDPFISCNNHVPLAHGSPWPGGRGPKTSFSGKLSAIFYLRHDRRNNLRSIALEESCHNLLEHSRTFNWLPQTLPPAIDLFDRVAKTIPSYDFGFVPDYSAIEVIREVIK